MAVVREHQVAYLVSKHPTEGGPEIPRVGVGGGEDSAAEEVGARAAAGLAPPSTLRPSWSPSILCCAMSRLRRSTFKWRASAYASLAAAPGFIHTILTGTIRPDIVEPRRRAFVLVGSLAAYVWALYVHDPGDNVA
jgi:hypothetical protein